MNSAIILAAGSGTRFDSEIPKQFTYLENEKMMVVEHSIIKFCNHTNIDEIILVCSKEWSKNLEKKYQDFDILNSKKMAYTQGGNSRTDSSYRGLKKCSKNSINVLIHDAARPFVTNKIINDALLYLDKFDAAIPTINCNDSLINIETLQYLQREKIKFIQTPQAFKYNKIFQSYEKLAKSDSSKKFSDDLSVLLKYNNTAKAKFFDGNKSNFKITQKDDLKKIK